METVAATDRATKTVKHLLGEALDVHVSYTWDTPDDRQPEYLCRDIVDSAIERLVHKVSEGLTRSGPIRISVEHSRSCHGNHGPLTEMRYVKVSVDGQGPSMVIAY